MIMQACLAGSAKPALWSSWGWVSRTCSGQPSLFRFQTACTHPPCRRFRTAAGWKAQRERAQGQRRRGQPVMWPSRGCQTACGARWPCVTWWQATLRPESLGRTGCAWRGAGVGGWPTNGASTYQACLLMLPALPFCLTIQHMPQRYAQRPLGQLCARGCCTSPNRPAWPPHLGEGGARAKIGQRRRSRVVQGGVNSEGAHHGEGEQGEGQTELGPRRSVNDHGRLCEQNRGSGALQG
jgi:hypothetical protein